MITLDHPPTSEDRASRDMTGQMDIEDKVRALSLTDLFASLDDTTARMVATEMTERSCVAGDYLFRAGSSGDEMFVIVSGRMRVLLPRQDGEEHAVRDMGPCETLGEIGVLTGGVRAASMLALRDTHLLVVSKKLFERLVQIWPRLALDIARQQIARLLHAQGAHQGSTFCQAILLLPAGATCELESLAESLCREFRKQYQTLLVRGEECSRSEADAGFTDAQGDEQEAKHRFAIYVGDSTLTRRTRMFINRADMILLVADSSADASLNSVEDAMVGVLGGRAGRQTHLVIREQVGVSASAEKWLTGRPVHLHHHLRHGSTADLERLCRHLTGRAHGLVLSGGGARGFAHIGVIRALRQSGISIDAAGGTSMGAFIAAMAALEMGHETMIEACTHLFIKRGVFDFTFPLVSLIAGKKTSRSLVEMFGDIGIEDLPVKHFSVTANLRNAQAVVHESGSVARWVGVSMRLPGVAPPFVSEGRLLCDGGIIDNLPVVPMERFTPSRVIAANVAPGIDLNVGTHWPELVTPWGYLAGKWKAQGSFPSILAILQRSALIGSEGAAAAASRRALHLFEPPVTRFGMFQWRAIRELVEIGYATAMRQLEESAGAQP